MGGLFSAVGRGLSAAGYAAGEMYGKQALMEAQSEQELNRAMRLAEFKEALDAQGDVRKGKLADEARQAQVTRIDAKAGELADAAVGEKRGQVDAGIADRSLWTAEQQSAVDQSLALDKKNIAADPETKIKASIATGDISPKDAATINRDERRLDATEKGNAARERAAEMKDATQRYIADLRHADSEKRLELLMRKMDKKDGSNGTKEALAFIDGARKELANDAQNLRAMYQSELKDLFDPADKARVKAEYEPKFAAIERKRTQVERDFNSLREKVGLPTSQPEPTPAPKPAPGNRPPLSSFMKK